MISIILAVIAIFAVIFGITFGICIFTMRHDAKLLPECHAATAEEFMFLHDSVTPVHMARNIVGFICGLVLMLLSAFIIAVCIIAVCITIIAMSLENSAIWAMCVLCFAFVVGTGISIYNCIIMSYKCSVLYALSLCHTVCWIPKTSAGDLRFHAFHIPASIIQQYLIRDGFILVGTDASRKVCLSALIP